MGTGYFRGPDLAAGISSEMRQTKSMMKMATILLLSSENYYILLYLLAV